MLNESDIARLAMLSRLEIAPDQLDDLALKLNGIFGLIEELRAVDTTGVEPMASALDMVQRLREDVVTEHDLREQFQAVAPQTENGLYLVPKVIE
jgi:aspartyl-tRNA(Asn)/glutamyl-tRNA(Gln) amidotransferase subunit C